LRALEIPEKFGALEIIDGQHRLFSFAKVSNPALLDSFNLAVIGVKGLSAERRRDTFVAINDNARRMDANLVALLRLNPDEGACQADPALMAIKIALALDANGPLKGRVRSLDYQRQVVTLKGLSGYDLRTLVGPRGELRQHVENKSEILTKLVNDYFSQVRRVFTQEWNKQDEYVVCTNRGIAAFLKLYKSMIRDVSNVPTIDEIHNFLSLLKANWVGKTWKTKELRNSYAGGQGAIDFHRDMLRSIRKKVRGFDVHRSRKA
jgi:DGQHR domain-containing protein